MDEAKMDEAKMDEAKTVAAENKTTDAIDSNDGSIWRINFPFVKKHLLI